MMAFVTQVVSTWVRVYACWATSVVYSRSMYSTVQVKAHTVQVEAQFSHIKAAWRSWKRKGIIKHVVTVYLLVIAPSW